MAPKMLILAAAMAFGSAVVNAQAAPSWQYVPSACASACSQTVETAYLCENEYSGSNTNINACFCSNFPSDAAGCSTCLNSNNAAALANLLTTGETACPAALKACLFECSFDTCASTDVACQCDATYLENIYQCASCNTANSNAGTTQLTDFQSLQQSCMAQNFTGAAQSFTTIPLASPTGSAGYTAPSLTATGGGAAATGDASALGVGTETGASATTAVTGSTTLPKASTTTKASSAAAGSSTKASTTAAASGAAATTSKAAADRNVAGPAVGVLALVGAVAALF